MHSCYVLASADADFEAKLAAQFERLQLHRLPWRKRSVRTLAATGFLLLTDFVARVAVGKDMLEISSRPGHHLGARLRRFRRLHGIKQDYLADTLGVSQGLISRWEAGRHLPSPEAARQILDLIAVAPDSSSDRALVRLVETAKVPVHLICDATHRLLAASRPREREWRASANTYIGRSLWRFATEEIVMAEDQLSEVGWFDLTGPARISIPTRGNGSNEMRILQSTLEWEAIGLADGCIGRLVTTVAFS